MNDAQVIEPGREVWIFFDVQVLDAASAAAVSMGTMTINDPADISMAAPGRPFITAEEDPVLAKIWDNDADEIFDSL